MFPGWDEDVVPVSPAASPEDLQRSLDGRVYCLLWTGSAWAWRGCRPSAGQKKRRARLRWRGNWHRNRRGCARYRVTSDRHVLEAKSWERYENRRDNLEHFQGVQASLGEPTTLVMNLDWHLFFLLLKISKIARRLQLSSSKYHKLTTPDVLAIYSLPRLRRNRC